MLRIVALLLVMSVAGLWIASATPLVLSASGQFSSSDVPGQLVSPNGVFVLSFVVDSNPVPLSGTVTSLGFDVSVTSFFYSLNGQSVSVAPTEIRFNTLANGGLFDITFGSGLTAQEFDFQGAQAFSGTTVSPTFSSGSYVVSSWLYSDPAGNYDSPALTSSSVQVAPAPEPASAILILGGLATLAVLRRREVNWAR